MRLLAAEAHRAQTYDASWDSLEKGTAVQDMIQHWTCTVLCLVFITACVVLCSQCSLYFGSVSSRVKKSLRLVLLALCIFVTKCLTEMVQIPINYPFHVTD